jgi:hypothetical protein
MFEMDAFVGVDVLGLSFMKGDQPHAGFPEAAYHGMAEQLARAGHRVVVVEQVGRHGPSLPVLLGSAACLAVLLVWRCSSRLCSRPSACCGE